MSVFLKAEKPKQFFSVYFYWPWIFIIKEIETMGQKNSSAEETVESGDNVQTQTYSYMQK